MNLCNSSKLLNVYFIFRQMFFLCTDWPKILNMYEYLSLVQIREHSLNRLGL